MHAYLQSKGNPRKKILIPDSAHGHQSGDGGQSAVTPWKI